MSKACEICKNPTKENRNRFCSRSCKSKYQWQDFWKKLNITKEQLEYLYWEDGLSLNEISIKLNVSRAILQTSFLRLGIKRRSKSEALKQKIKNGYQLVPNKKRGELNHNWKGGKRRNHNGYILVYAPNHPRATSSRYTFEHILVWEKHNKRPIPIGWHIHHINGKVDDNRIENLIAVSSQEHKKYHKKRQKLCVQ